MQSISEDLLDELFVRFFTDITSYNNDISKFFWELEKMYWYYIDITKSKEKPSKQGMKIFVDEIKYYLASVLPVGMNIDSEYNKWIDSRRSVPRCKVILLDSQMENVVLTKGVFNDYLIFPGGKVEETDNDLAETAIREVYEEIGVNITDKINRNLYFDLHQYGVKNRYFVVPNINKNIFMHPNVQHEIEFIKWFPIADLPDNISKHNLKKSNVKLIIQSVEALKRFIPSLKS